MTQKLVILASRFPFPLIKGDKVRLYHQIIELSGHFEIYLICINEFWPTKKDFEAVRTYCQSVTVHIIRPGKRKWNILTNYWNKMPMQVRYFYDRHTHDRIIQQVSLIEPDHIYVQLIRMVPYVEGLQVNVPKSIDFMDSMILNDLARQYLSHKIPSFIVERERRLVSEIENHAFQVFDRHFTISERDKLHFNPLYRQKLQVLNNGVDKDFFSFHNGDEERIYDVIFCGNLSYRPNREAILIIIHEILPHLRGIRLLIAGAELDEKLAHALRLVDQQEHKRNRNEVVIKGFQEDIRTVYREGKIMIAPIFSGSGQQNKVLEAMASGVPCIVSSFVNDGLEAKEGYEILIADDNLAFISHINDLISQPEKREKLRKAARMFIERKFDWSKNTSALVTSLSKEVNT